jgi:uncharacterized Zn-binding protein involved in type VI secretion
VELGRPSTSNLQHRLPTRTANTHDVHNVVNLDDLIEYSTNTHMTETSHDHGETSMFPPDTLIAHMSGQTKVDLIPPGDIRQVLASQQRPIGRKGNNIKTHETSTTPATLTMGDTTYYLNKGEMVTFQGHQYFTHATIIQYFVSQHTVSTNDLALIDRGANGCLCGDDMLVLEVSEGFDDVSGLGVHCENQLRIHSFSLTK